MTGFQDVRAVERPAADVKRYARRRYVLFAAHLCVGGIFLAAVIFGGSAWLARAARELAGPGTFLRLVFFYFVGFSLSYLVVTLPLTFYSEFVLERQFGLSTQTFGGWAGRRVKKWFFSFVIVTPVILAIYWLLRRYPQNWWMPASAVWILFSFVLARFAPQILVPLFYRLEPIADGALTARLVGLAARAGVAITGVCRIDLSRETKKANAAVVGLGSSRRVVLGDTLLSAFTTDEIAVVFAHELGHIVHRDMATGFALASVLAVGSLWAGSIVLSRATGALGIAHIHSPETMPLLVLVAAAIQLLVLPLEKWYSRWRETASDAFALRLTADRDAFISSMQKLGAMNLADVNPNRLAEILLFSHPPIAKRISFAKSWEPER